MKGFCHRRIISSFQIKNSLGGRVRRQLTLFDVGETVLITVDESCISLCDHFIIRTRCSKVIILGIRCHLRSPRLARIRDSIIKKALKIKSGFLGGISLKFNFLRVSQSISITINKASVSFCDNCLISRGSREIIILGVSRDVIPASHSRGCDSAIIRCLHIESCLLIRIRIKLLLFCIGNTI